MKEFELTLRLRNNLLKRRRVELGLSTTQLAEAAGISYGLYMQFEGLKKDPYKKNGEWTETALRLADFHGLSPEELWPSTILAVQKPTLVTELEAEEALALGGYVQTLELPPTPEELLLLQEKSRVVQDAMKQLRPRERRALHRKFVEDQTNREAGEDFYDGSFVSKNEKSCWWDGGVSGGDISGTRVQQIVQGAIRKLGESRWGYFDNALTVKRRKALREVDDD